MSKKKYNIVIVAHPDDETIFFAGLMQKDRRLPWMVICVTDGNADGRGSERHRELEKACRLLKVHKLHHLQFQDIYEQRISQIDLKSEFDKILKSVRIDKIYTHSIIGDYGHPHHQDVSLACHRWGAENKIPVWSVAMNTYPDKIIRLTSSQFKIKSKILSQVYFDESKRFYLLLTPQAFEGFVKCRLNEVEALYELMTKKLDRSVHEQKINNLSKWKWLQPYLVENAQYKRGF